jgi:hypothetical protein
MKWKTYSGANMSNNTFDINSLEELWKRRPKTVARLEDEPLEDKVNDRLVEEHAMALQKTGSASVTG